MPNSRKRLSPPQWQALIEQQQAGNLSVMAFCREHDLNLKSFYYHRKKRADQQQPIQTQHTAGFIKMQPPSSATATSSGHLVLHYQHSRLALDTSVSPAWLAELMRLL